VDQWCRHQIGKTHVPHTNCNVKGSRSSSSSFFPPFPPIGHASVSELGNRKCFNTLTQEVKFKTYRTNSVDKAPTIIMQLEEEWLQFIPRNHHYARSPNLRRALDKMLDAQGSRPALPRHRLKSNLRRASHASQITKMQDAPQLRRVSPWLHTGFPGSQMQDEL
jgi:hypothetical protein